MRRMVCAALFLFTLETYAAETLLDIVKTSGVKGGLVVVVGREGSDSVADARLGERYLVSGLCEDAGVVAAGRNAIRAKGNRGKVTVDVWDGETLPYVDNLVKLDSLEHALLGLDLRSGEVRKRLPTTDIFRIGHHHRCYRNKATSRYVFLKAIPVLGDGELNKPLLVTHSGLLDDSMFERSFWYVVRPGQPPIGAQLMVHDDKTAFGFKAYPSAQRGGPWHVIGTGYTLFSALLKAAAKPPATASAPPHVPDFYHKPWRRNAWQVKVPVRARAMTLTDNVLLPAGSPDTVREGTDPYAAVEGQLGGRLLSIGRKDGSTLAEHALAAPPVWDGMAVVGSGVYIVDRDGSVTRIDTLP